MDAGELKGQQMLVRYRTERGDLGWGVQVQYQEEWRMYHEICDYRRSCVDDLSRQKQRE